jgi:hypothetical protein
VEGKGQGVRTLIREAEEPPALSRDLTAEAAALIDAARTAQRQVLALVTALAAGTGDGTLILELADAGARLGENAMGLREVASAIADAAACRFALEQAHSAGVAAGAGLVAVPDAPGRHRRGRVPRQRGTSDRPLLNIVRGIVPVGALGAVLKHAWKPALRHHALKAAAWAAHPAHLLGVTAAVAAPVVLVAAAVHVMSPVVSPASASAPGSVPAPAASAYAAVPIASADPGTPVLVREGADVRSSGQLPAGVLAPWFAAPSFAPPAASPSPAIGVLTADVTALDLGTGTGTAPLTGTVTITAANGPVTFGAVPGSEGEVAVSPAAGSLTAGQSVTLTISVPAAAQVAGGSATVRVWGGSSPALTITVVWQAVPAPAPSASPSPVAADLAPSDSPTPDPSSS